jgi:cell division septum initiation protein DivIVA
MNDPRHDLQAAHVAQHSFDVVLRGYDKSQVAETIERLEADFRIALADRDAAVTRSADLASQLSAMHGEIESLRRKAAHAQAPTFENISERIQHMLQLAEEEAGEIRRSAELEAHAVREHIAGEERAMLERQAAGQAEVERMLAEARQGAEQIMQNAQLRADDLVAKAQERVARLDAESQARRAKVEEDFEIAQRVRRAEAARQEEERERVSTEAARQRLSAADRQAAQLVAEAEAKAEAIRDVRDELTGRLLQARQLLSTLPDLADRPQMPAREEPRVVAAVAQPTQPAVQQSGQPAEGRRSEAEPAARPQPVPSEPATSQLAPAAARAEATSSRLPMPPRPTPGPAATGAPAGSSAGSASKVQNPPTQAIDQPVEARG